MLLRRLAVAAGCFEARRSDSDTSGRLGSFWVAGGDIGVVVAVMGGFELMLRFRRDMLERLRRRRFWGDGSARELMRASEMRTDVGEDIRVVADSKGGSGDRGRGMTGMGRYWVVRWHCRGWRRRGGGYLCGSRRR